MDTVTKRFHISGLTPQITQADLVNRLSSFGNVKSVDGFGKLDGIGSPRSFAFVTLEGNKNQLSRCTNLLSGTVWKGAKLRIGDARPDYRERLVKEKQAQEDSDRPKKRIRLMRGCQGKLSADMTPVSIENFSTRHGWTKTPAGRLIRPMRMRPLHPLPPTPHAALPVSTKVGTKSRRRRRRAAPDRARRRLINPVIWGSEYVKGPLLDSFHYPQNPIETASTIKEGEAYSPGSDADETDDSSGNNGEMSEDDIETERETVLKSTWESNKKPTVADSSPVKFVKQPSVPSSEFAQEAARVLALLNSIFGSKEDDWGGEESLSDVDMNVAQTRTTNVGQAVEGEGFEIVPREKAGVEVVHSEEEKDSDDDDDEDEEEEEMKEDEDSMSVDEERSKETQETAVGPSQSEAIMEHAARTTKLKDMFKLHDEEEVGFSIMDNLGSEIDLDEEFDIAPKPMVVTHMPVEEDARRVITTTTNEKIVFDPNQILFFPRDRSKDGDGSRKSKLKDIFDVIEEKGLFSSFVRTETPEETKARWQVQKSELTRFWKKHHREAVKQSKRRGGGGRQRRD